MQYFYSCYTDVGIRKQVNQDACVVKAMRRQGKNYLLAVMCDGVGGLSSGEVASANAVREFSEWFEHELVDLLEGDENLDDILFQRWNLLINKINDSLVEYGKKQHEKLGTTLSCLLITGNEYYIAHVGDSRIYLMNPGLQQLTEDQTLVAKEVREGILTPEQALTDPRGNIILQCVGAMKRVAPDFIKGHFSGDVTFLLCTDGFRHKISEEEIMNYLGEYTPPESMKQNLHFLTETVKERGEKDNITSILIKTYSDDETTVMLE